MCVLLRDVLRLTFSAGSRSCIGWKFAYVLSLSSFDSLNHPQSRVIEMQEFLVSLLSNFEFSVPDNAKRIRRDRSGFVTPMVEGEECKGAQLPLTVSVLVH